MDFEPLFRKDFQIQILNVNKLWALCGPLQVFGFGVLQHRLDYLDVGFGFLPCFKSHCTSYVQMMSRSLLTVPQNLYIIFHAAMYQIT